MLPNFPNIASKVAKSFLHESCIIFNSPKIYQNIWATFVSKFATKNFRKSPNLVTLLVNGTNERHNDQTQSGVVVVVLLMASSHFYLSLTRFRKKTFLSL